MDVAGAPVVEDAGADQQQQVGRGGVRRICWFLNMPGGQVLALDSCTSPSSRATACSLACISKVHEPSALSTGTVRLTTPEHGGRRSGLRSSRWWSP